MEQWIDLVKAKGPDNRKERAQWLKSQFKLGTNYADWIAHRVEGISEREQYNPEALVEAMFAGKDVLKPAYERLLELAFMDAAKP